MRQLLGALRPESPDRMLRPQPTITDISALVENAAKVGTHATVTSFTNGPPLSPIIQLTVYRIVQEALSNAVRHAPFADTRVVIATEPTHVTVSIENDAPEAAPSQDRSRPEIGGQGLRGMRERVALLDGNVTQTKSHGGGFLVTATIPIRADESQDRT